jgi:hypothetical protein
MNRDRLAQPTYKVISLLFSNKRVPHSDVLAKYAAAFFKDVALLCNPNKLSLYLPQLRILVVSNLAVCLRYSEADNLLIKAMASLRPVGWRLPQQDVFKQLPA